jgi:hypothetical protein
MNKKRIFFVIPTVLFPYFALCALAVIFFSTKHPLCEWIMERVFGSNAWSLIGALLLLALLTVALTIICFVKCICNSWDAVSMAKTAMIVKLTQVPAYVLIFILGVLFVITLFTIPFTFGLYLLDCLTLALTGFLTLAAVICAIRQGLCTWKECIWVVILQFIFCGDVVASILFFRMLKKRIPQ